MILTVEEAKEKICCLPEGVNIIRCIADGCVQALTEEDEDIDKALEKAIEYYHIGGGNQGSNPEYYMRAAMNTVLSILCASTEESIEQAKRFRPTFKMKAYKKGE